MLVVKLQFPTKDARIGIRVKTSRAFDPQVAIVCGTGLTFETAIQITEDICLDAAMPCRSARHREHLPTKILVPIRRSTFDLEVLGRREVSNSLWQTHVTHFSLALKKPRLWWRPIMIMSNTHSELNDVVWRRVFGDTGDAAIYSSEWNIEDE